MKIRKIFALSALLFSALVSFAQEGGVEVDYNRPVKYKVGGISVKGNNYFSENQIIQLTGLEKGMEITVPSDELSGIVRRLWLQRYFEDVSMEIDHLSADRDSAFLNIVIVERPRVSRWSFTGVKSGEKKDLQERLNLRRGGEFSDYVEKTSSDIIKKYFAEKGFLDCQVKAEVVKENGVQTLYLSRTNGVVRLVTDQSSSGNWKTESAWSDGIGLRAGVDFLIDATTCAASSGYFAARTQASSVEESFAGRSLTVRGTDTKSARVLIKSGGLAGDDLRMGANGWICGSGSLNNAVNQYVTGTVTVASTSVRASPATFATSSDRTFEVRAELKGSGCVGISATAERGDGRVRFTRPNPEFTGKVVVKMNYPEDDGKQHGTVRLQITSEECLGAAPASLTADAVEVCPYAHLESVCDVTLDDPTRGLTFGQAASFSVMSGTVFTVKTPLTLKGTLYKRGKGLLVLDADMTAANKGLRVLDGCVRVDRADTFWNFYRIRSNTDTAFVFPAQPVNEDMGTYGLAMGRNDNTGESPFLDNDSESVNPSLPVQVDFGDTPPSGTVRVPICSILPTKADSLRGHIDVLTSLKGFTCAVEEDSVTYKNKQLTRFTAVFRPSGACIIFR